MAAIVWQRNFAQLFMSNFLKHNKGLVKFNSSAHVAVTDDTTTVVFWHPEPHFPYECSKPLPDKVVPKSDSVLKVQSLQEFWSVFKPKKREFLVEELRTMTFTTKHIWYVPGQRYRRKPAPPRDRPYL